MKQVIAILGIATLLAGVTPAVDAQPKQTLLAQSQTYDLSQQGEDKLKNGDYQGAVKVYNQVLQLNPKDNHAYVNRGMARFELGDKHGAVDDFTQALQLNPNDAEAYRQRGGVYLTLGDKKKAREDLQQATKLTSNRGGGAISPPTQNPTMQLQQ